MSTGPAEPDVSEDEIEEVSAALHRIGDRAPTDPQGALAELAVLRDRVRTWPTSLASARAAIEHRAAQAHRYADELDNVVAVVDSGLLWTQPGSQTDAMLRLERGMAYAQHGQQQDAETELSTAGRIFAALAITDGCAWTSSALSDVLATTGRPREALEAAEVAYDCAVAADDEPIRRRALRQQASAERQLGRTADALIHITEALDGHGNTHSRGNLRLEQGHILALANDPSAALDAYQDALTVYLQHGDILGQANVYRAVANVELQLGHTSAAEHNLKLAEARYEQYGSVTGIANILRERSIVCVDERRFDEAAAAAIRSVELFRSAGDMIGVSSALRAVARAADLKDAPTLRDGSLAESLAISEALGSDHALANAYLMSAEIGPEPNRLAHALQAAELWTRIGNPLGVAHGYALAAQAQLATEAVEALDLVRRATEAHRQARVSIRSASIRGRYDDANSSIAAPHRRLRLDRDPGGSRGRRRRHPEQPPPRTVRRDHQRPKRRRPTRDRACGRASARPRRVTRKSSAHPTRTHPDRAR